MLTFDPLKDEVLDAIAVLIGQRLRDDAIPKMSKQLVLAETIAIAEIPLHATEGKQTRPAFHSHWFHQLKSGNKYVGYVISTPIGPAETDWMVEGIYKADLSNQVATAVRWVDKNVEGDGIVRLLVEPRHHLHALIITNSDQVRAVVAHLPRRIGTLRKRAVYSWTDLFAQLSKNAPVRGVEVSGPATTRGPKVPRGKMNPPRNPRARSKAR